MNASGFYRCTPRTASEVEPAGGKRKIPEKKCAFRGRLKEVVSAYSCKENSRE